MVESVTKFALARLWELLSREFARLSGIHEEISGLKVQLERLQSFLKDAEAKKCESERVRNFLEDVKDIVYDAEDIIESFLLREVGEKGIKKRLKRLACCLVDRRRSGSDIQDITKRISELIAGMQSFGIQQVIDGGRSLSLQDRQRKKREIRQTYPNSSESDLVGLEQRVEELADHLVKEDNIQVISISGMGGIGKTTLARQVFHHKRVRKRFNGFTWVCVSQQFNRMDLWQRMLQDLKPKENNIKQMDEHTLHGKLFQLLESGRYLIVLDDIWKKEDWDRIKAVFPKNRGWKIILTSRNEGVGLHVDPTCFGFRSSVLTPEESWKLCEKIVFSRRQKNDLCVNEELETMGKKMVTYCGGLPLAVKVLGGLLAEKHTVPEWKRVSDNIGSQIIGKSSLDDTNLSSVNQVLSLSYEDLPSHLKHCFLYLAHFPEDYEIPVDTLSEYWVADGILAPFYDGTSVQECFEELAKRHDVSGNYNSCQMHDMMREVCLLKAKEENFLQVVESPTLTCTIQSLNRSRRVAVLLKYGDVKAIQKSDLLFLCHSRVWISQLLPEEIYRCLGCWIFQGYILMEGSYLPASESSST